MPTIKVKKEMNLPELIEWGFNNPELSKGKVYNIDDENDRFAAYVSFLPDVTGVRVPCTITQNNTFTVEVEESVTENTEFELMIEIADGYQYLYKRASVEDWKDEDSKEFHAYIDGEFKLIWRDGRLIE